MVKRFIEDPVEIEEKALTENYKTWKKSVPFLHEMVMTHTLHWPSFTFQWLKSDLNPDRHIEKSSILVSAKTNEGKSHLLNSDVYLPDNSLLENKSNQYGAFSQSGGGRIIVRRRLVVEGNVLKCNTMSYGNQCNTNLQHMIIAEMDNDLGISIYDMRNGIVGEALEDEEQMVEWSGQRIIEPYQRILDFNGAGGIAIGPSGRLAGALKNNKGVGLWSLDNVTRTGILQPYQCLGIDKDNQLLSVAWWKSRNSIVMAANDAGDLLMWDIRNSSSKNKPCLSVLGAHRVPDSGAINMCVSPSPFSHCVIASCGSGARGPALWDVRNLRLRIHTLGNISLSSGIKHEVNQLKWSPHYENLLAGDTVSINSSGRNANSGSNSSNILIWDLNILQEEDKMRKSTRSDPADLVFVHGGHTGRVGDFDWHPDIGGVIGSTADDNILQIWKPLESLVKLADITKSKTGDAVASEACTIDNIKMETSEKAASSSIINNSVDKKEESNIRIKKCTIKIDPVQSNESNSQDNLKNFTHHNTNKSNATDDKVSKSISIQIDLPGRVANVQYQSNTSRQNKSEHSTNIKITEQDDKNNDNISLRLSDMEIVNPSKNEETDIIQLDNEKIATEFVKDKESSSTSTIVPQLDNKQMEISYVKVEDDVKNLNNDEIATKHVEKKSEYNDTIVSQLDDIEMEADIKNTNNDEIVVHLDVKKSECNDNIVLQPDIEMEADIKNINNDEIPVLDVQTKSKCTDYIVPLLDNKQNKVDINVTNIDITVRIHGETNNECNDNIVSQIDDKQMKYDIKNANNDEIAVQLHDETNSKCTDNIIPQLDIEMEADIKVISNDEIALQLDSAMNNECTDNIVPKLDNEQKKANIKDISNDEVSVQLDSETKNKCTDNIIPQLDDKEIGADIKDTNDDVIKKPREGSNSNYFNNIAPQLDNIKVGGDIKDTNNEDVITRFQENQLDNKQIMQEIVTKDSNYDDVVMQQHDVQSSGSMNDFAPQLDNKQMEISKPEIENDKKNSINSAEIASQFDEIDPFNDENVYEHEYKMEISNVDIENDTKDSDTLNIILQHYEEEDSKPVNNDITIISNTEETNYKNSNNDEMAIQHDGDKSSISTNEDIAPQLDNNSMEVSNANNEKDSDAKPPELDIINMERGDMIEECLESCTTTTEGAILHLDNINRDIVQSVQPQNDTSETTDSNAMDIE